MQFVFLEFILDVDLNLVLVGLREGFKLSLKRTKLKEFSFLGKFSSFKGLDFLLLCCDLVREELVLVVQDLEVLLCSQKLVIVIIALLFCLKHLLFLVFEDLFKFYFGCDANLHVCLLALDLSLQSLNGSTASVLTSSDLKRLFLQAHNLLLESLFVHGQLLHLVHKIGLLRASALQFILQLLDSVFVLSQLFTN